MRRICFALIILTGLSLANGAWAQESPEASAAAADASSGTRLNAGTQSALLPQDGTAQERGANFVLTLEPTLTWQRSQEGPIIPRWNQALLAQRFLWQPFPYTSADGQYAAQREEEVKTYDELQMNFQYMEQPFWRKQLKLADGEGLIVLEARPEGEGFRQGFRDGDIIVTVDQEPIDTQYDFVIAVTDHRGNPQDVTIRRDGEPLNLVVKLTETPDGDVRYVLGISVEPISELLQAQLKTSAGVAITGIQPDSAASAAGLQVHDVIVAMNGTEILTLDNLKQVVQEAKSQPIDVALIRKGKRISIEVTPKKDEHRVAVTADVKLVHTVPHFARVPLLTHTPTNAYGEWRLAPAVEAADVAVEPTSESATILEKLTQLEAKIDRLAESIQSR
jgi:hypothetical protein